MDMAHHRVATCCACALSNDIHVPGPVAAVPVDKLHNGQSATTLADRAQGTVGLKGAADMKIERRFTRAGADVYADLDFTTTTSEIRNPDGTVVFKLENVEVPAGWSQVASDVIAQKYFRKAGVPARLKPVKEKGVPEFLWRQVADEEALQALPKRRAMSARPRPSRCSAVWPGLGPIGAGRAAISPPKPMPAPISTKCS
jgi:hypothetical protein